MSTTEAALTAHLVMPAGHPGDCFILGLADELRHHHGVGHVTLQVELDGATCPLAPAHVIKTWARSDRPRVHGPDDDGAADAAGADLRNLEAKDRLGLVPVLDARQHEPARTWSFQPTFKTQSPPGPALEVSEATVQRDLKANSSLWKNQNPPRASDLNLWQARCFSGWADLPRGRSPFSGALR